jgi:hypothetical protein
VKRGLAILAALTLASLHLAADDVPVHQLALDLYYRGEFADCRGLVRRMIDDYAAGVIRVPVRQMAAVYLVAACLADVYRDAGYVEAVDDNIHIALEMDPNVDPSLARSRTYVESRFTEIRAGLIASQGPMGRRFAVGAILAGEGPGGIHWRNVPLFGIRLAVGILQWLSIEGGASLPIQGLPLDEAEVYLGGTFRPAFAFNRPMLAMNASYVATHRNAWTHGLSLGGGAEIALRAGVSFRAMMELLRLEGSAAPDPDAGDFPSFPLFGGTLTLSLPRLTLSAAYAF